MDKYALNYVEKYNKNYKPADICFRMNKLNLKYDDDDCCFSIRDDLLPICFNALHHLEKIKGIELDEELNWRMKDRNNKISSKMKTVSVALVLCLNIGVAPPDVMKIDPCSRLECWIDPETLTPQKALEMVGSNLQKQYERWQPRARYKKSMDPTTDDIKKLCTSLRRNAKEERVLFHYNGHGVPLPTKNGEIWVFNKHYTQYIPLSIYELQNWMGAPSIYIYDCSHAGIIVKAFNQFAHQHEEGMKTRAISAVNVGEETNVEPQYISFLNCIQLGACSDSEFLPMNPKLPADLFTSCLTTPIKMALKWYTMLQGQGRMMLVPEITADLIDRIPGQIADRRTMLGELNWIFTAITDTIAWNSLERDLFQKLFRQDLLVASLFRNYLLAERILKHHDCTPVSSPQLPECYRHPMWAAWDLAVDLALQQLPNILEKDEPYKQSPFFEEQLTAFQVWLDRGSDQRTPPEQLPIVLQVLLSQVHRLRALELLGKFLDLGSWAVHLALGVGIFPYVLKLLLSAAAELRPVLVHIWAKILAVDSMCQVDLYKHNKYFISVLQDPTEFTKETRTLAAFVMASIVNNFREGQKSALQDSLVSICLVQLYDEDPLLRQWLIICLGQLWKNFAEARWSGVRDLAHDKLTECLLDPVPEVRAAAVFALGTFISSVTNRTEEHANNIDRNIATNLLKIVGEDMSPLVRLELVAALQWMVILFESNFVSVFIPELIEIKSEFRPENSITFLPQFSTKDIVTALLKDSNMSYKHQTHSLERNVMRRGFSSNSFNNIAISSSLSSPPHGTSNIPYATMFMKLWQGICNLGRDPSPKVSEAAFILLEHITDRADLALMTAKEATVIEKCTSVSLPPSPNTRSHFLGESPPQRENSNGAATIHCGSAGARKDTIMGRNGVEITMSSTPQPQRARSRSSQTTDDGMTKIKPLVETQFIPWCISQFSRPKKRLISENGQEKDKHSENNRAKVVRYKRNENIRRLAFEEQARAMYLKIEKKVHYRNQFSPSIIKMFPYEPQIAVAHKDRVSIVDIHDANISHCNPDRKKSSSNRLRNSFDFTKISKVSTVELINSHDLPLVMIGHDNGMIRLWQESGRYNGQRNYKLVTAWMGLPFSSSNSALCRYTSVSPGMFSNWQQRYQNLIIGETSPQFVHSPTSPRNSIDLETASMISTWQQRSQHLIVGDLVVNGNCGPNRYLRIWDAKTELKVGDMLTNSDSNLKVLASYRDVIAAGYSNGSVSLFDKRCPFNECRIKSYREHKARLLTACLRDDHSLITACAQGRVNLYDLRSKGAPTSWETDYDVTDISVHQEADVIACGSTSNIRIYGLDGKSHTTLWPQSEGILSSRKEHTCLSFHPHQISLAVVMSNNVYVYGSRGFVS